MLLRSLSDAQPIARRGALRCAIVVALLGPVAPASGVASPASTASTPTWDLERVAVTHRSGGEIAYLPGRQLVATVDRFADAAPAALRPSITVVDAGRRRQVHQVRLWDLAWATGSDGVPVPHVPSGLDAHPPTGRLVTTNSAAGTITIADVDADAPGADDVVAVGGHPFGVEVDHRGRLAYVASYREHRIDVVDLRTKRIVDRITGLRHPTKLALDERRGRLYVGNADRAPSAVHTISVVDVGSRAVVASVPVDPNSRPAVDLRTGTVYAASFATGRIAVIDPDGLEATPAAIETGSTPHGVGVDHRRGLLYAPNLLANTVTVIDARRARVIATVPVDGVPLGVAIDDVRGWAWISLRDRSEVVALRLDRAAATRAAGGASRG